jgi:nucleoid-associated protein YgaU
MRVSRVFLVLTATAALTGCGYIHFGRLPRATNNTAMESAFLDLSVQQKILKQELTIAHKENDTLRAALDRGAPAADGKADLTRQLEATTQELAAVRASYAKLQEERKANASAAGAASDNALVATREKLALLSSDAARLQEENTQLKQQLDAARTENATLASQLKTTLADKEQAETAARQLNSELATAKDARAQAEQAIGSLRAQLDAVMARAARAESAPTSSAATSSAEPAPAPTIPAAATNPAPSPLAELQAAKEPPSGSAPAVELHTSLARARAAAASSNPAPAPQPETPPPASAPTNADATPTSPVAADTTATPPSAPAPAIQTYTVQPGDTLEKIATKFYGAANEWGKIYAANSEALSAGSGIKPGMVLKIPEK